MGGGGGGYCHFEFAYLYELICNAKSIQRFKGTLQCDWLLVWSPDTLFVHYFAHLPIYLGVEFLVEGLHTSVSRFCCCCVFQRCFSCLKNMSKPCYWQEAKQPRYRGRIKYLQHGKALVPQTLMHTYIYIYMNYISGPTIFFRVLRLQKFMWLLTCTVKELKLFEV